MDRRASINQCIRSDSISSREAIRLLHARMKDVATEDDPAPWFVVSQDLIECFADGDEAGYVRRTKLQERTKRLMLRGLLSGNLNAHFSDGIEARDIPGWAWEAAERHDYPWLEGRLPLDVLLPDEWLRWHCGHVFLDLAQLEGWMKSQDLASIEGLVPLPGPFDVPSRPDRVTHRLPPDQPFVGLSEALSWIAFGVSLGNGALKDAISAHALGSAAEMQSRVADAVAKLTQLASGDQIAMRGRYFANHAVDENTVLTEPIEPIRLADFRQFDDLYDGLRYGEGLTWSEDESGGRRASSGRHDEYRYVTVNRSDLLKHFPIEVHPVPIPARPTYEQLVDWCRRYISDGRGNGMDGAWIAFRSEPWHQGLTRDDAFRPAWRTAKTS